MSSYLAVGERSARGCQPVNSREAHHPILEEDIPFPSPKLPSGGVTAFGSYRVGLRLQISKNTMGPNSRKPDVAIDGAPRSQLGYSKTASQADYS